MDEEEAAEDEDEVGGVVTGDETSSESEVKVLSMA